MNTEFFNALDILEKEKGISKEYMLEKVEAALVAAFKRDNNGNSNVRVVMDPVKKDVKVYEQKTIVEEVEDEAEEGGLARSVVAHEAEHGALTDGVVVYVDGDFFAEAFLEVIDGNHKF